MIIPPHSLYLTVTTSDIVAAERAILPACSLVRMIDHLHSPMLLKGQGRVYYTHRYISGSSSSESQLCSLR